MYSQGISGQTRSETHLVNQKYDRVPVIPYSVSNQQLPVTGALNQHSYLQPLVGGDMRTYSQPLVSGNVQSQVNSNVQGQTDATLIGQDLWKQLRRVSVSVFTGDKKNYQNWKAAFTACIDQAPATAEYKLLQLKQCLGGEALKAIDSLGHSAAAYEAAKERLERKYGGQRRQIALYLEEIDNFRPVQSGNFKDLEKYTDLLDIAIINLKEANRQEELSDGLLYVKLQKKLPTSMLARYHRWIYENYKIESVEVLREWVIQETGFQIRAVETIQGFTTRSETRGTSRDAPFTFFGRSNSGFKTEAQTKSRICKLCGKQHGIWMCNEFKEMDLKHKWEVAKKLKLCFRCLDEGHLGQSCFRSRTCGLDGCQEFHHRLLHQHTMKKTSGASLREGMLLHNKDTDSKDQQQKSVKSEQNISVVSKAVASDNGGETIDKNGKVTLMSKTSIKGNIALRTVSVYLRNGDRKLKINALLDDASTKTYINADVAAELGLQGHSQKVNVSVLNGQVETFETTPVEFTLESLDGKRYNITALTTDKVTGNMRVTDWSTCAKQWPHLKGIQFHQLGSRPIVDLLIGLDSAVTLFI